MTTLPTWAVWLVSIGTPIASFVGVLLAQFITRKAARELETRSRREETMRNLRWLQSWRSMTTTAWLTSGWPS